MNGLVDAHCHLDSDRLARSVDATIGEARAVGVEAIVMAGVGPHDFDPQRAIARAYPGFAFPVFGLHPQWVAEVDRAAVDDGLVALEGALTSDSPPVAVGEMGLDALTDARAATLPLQEVALREQLALARRCDLPVVLHLLRATGRALALLEEVGVGPAGGVVHSFGGSPEVALRYVALGLHVSFCGTLTYPQSRRLRAAAAAVPLDRLLIETDAPDQTPHPRRAETNRPALLPLVASALAEARGVPVEAIAAATADNARRVFRLPR